MDNSESAWEISADTKIKARWASYPGMCRPGRSADRLAEKTEDNDEHHES
jgi:hypothetical protein